jgi:hypothetical protein
LPGCQAAGSRNRSSSRRGSRRWHPGRRSAYCEPTPTIFDHHGRRHRRVPVVEHGPGVEIACAALAQELVAAADKGAEPGRVLVVVGTGIARPERDRTRRGITDGRRLLEDPRIRASGAKGRPFSMPIAASRPSISGLKAAAGSSSITVWTSS